MKRFLIFIVVVVIMATACTRSPGSESQPGQDILALPDIPDCARAELIGETIPAGTTFQAGERFTKVWDIRNISACNWDSDFSLAYFMGVGMGEASHLLFTSGLPEDAIIPPGETVTLTLNLRAPFAPGRQVGFWKLRDSKGLLFMPENVSSDALSVDIDVIGTVYSFADNLCQAVWELDDQEISCPVTGDSSGYQLMVNSYPEFEGGKRENEPTISILLPGSEGSRMTATFPAMLINKGDHLHLGTACADKTPQCDLTYEVKAQTETGTVAIGEWHEISDDNIQVIDLDLSHLAGLIVQFLFSLHSNGAIQGNRGLWYFPILLPY
jgi:hypothetical protein